MSRPRPAPHPPWAMLCILCLLPLASAEAGQAAPAAATASLGNTVSAVAPGPSPSLRPAPPAEPDSDRDAGADDEEKAEQAAAAAARRKAICALFSASEATFTKAGMLRLTYEFRKEDDDLARDWSPPMARTKRRVRWAMVNDEGLMISDAGTYAHRAVWRGTVQMDIEGVSYAQMDGGDYRVAGLVDARGKRMIGTNIGQQIVALTGDKITSAFPRKFPVSRVEEKHAFGFGLRKGVFTERRRGRAVANTEKKPKFTRRFETGRVALRWRGRTQFCIHKVVIEGTLDPAWLKKQLGKPRE